MLALVTAFIFVELQPNSNMKPNFKVEFKAELEVELQAELQGKFNRSYSIKIL